MTIDELAAKLEAIGYTPEDAVFLLFATAYLLTPPPNEPESTNEEGSNVR